MGSFSSPVRDYMTSPAVYVRPDAELAEAHALMQRHDISGLAVVDEDGRVVGVISRADLVERGQLDTVHGTRMQLVHVSREKVAQVMSDKPLCVTPDRPVSDAARIMDKHRIHRVFVERDGRLVGVLSTFDLMRAIQDHGVTTPIGELASRGVVSVAASDPVSLALSRMQASHVQGVVVTDQRWPVGVFTQADALAARHAPANTHVADLMNPAVLVLPEELAIHRAAMQAAATRARRIVVTNGLEPCGIVSGLDFARAVR